MTNLVSNTCFLRLSLPCLGTRFATTRGSWHRYGTEPFRTLSLPPAGLLPPGGHAGPAHGRSGERRPAAERDAGTAGRRKRVRRRERVELHME